MNLKFQEHSACKFFLVSNCKAWLVAIMVVVMQIHMLHTLIRASDFAFDVNNWEYSMSCTCNKEACDNSRLISICSWIVFSVIAFVFLSKDQINRLFIVHESLEFAGRLKDPFARFVILCITSILIILSVLHNHSLSLSDTDLLKDVVILLFLSEVDGKFFNIADHAFPTWTDQRNK